MTPQSAAAALDLASFVDAGVTPYHAVDEAARRLTDAGFARQQLADEWQAGAGGHFAVVDGSIVAWWLPESAGPTTGLRVLAAHTDSPVLKVKPRPDTGSAGWRQVGVEVYGGALWNSWLDRDLGLAGRLALIDGSTVGVRIEQPLLRIPQLPPHLDRGVNVNGLKLNPQQHLVPVWSIGQPADGELIDFVAGESGIDPADVVAHDLTLHDLTPPALLGREQDLLSAPRLDNLSSTGAGLAALLSVAAGNADPDTISVFAAFDHEEVGSGSASGAGGPVLERIIRRLVGSLGGGEEQLARMLAASRCLSADAAHAVNPNYLGYFEPQHHLVINAGPALKINADQHYGTDGIGAAAWHRACRQADAPVQTFVGRNDVSCGSTLGKFVATALGVRTVDVGIPILSMHSTRELGGVRDIGYFSGAIEAFLTDPS